MTATTNMSKAREYMIGSLLRVATTFTDVDGDAVNPSGVRLIFKNPAGNLTTWVYGDSPDVILNGTTKEYSAQIPLTMDGTWYYRWESSGNYQAAAERMFIVLPSQL